MIKTGIGQTYSYIEIKDPAAIEFSILDQEEILKSSVVSIKNERIYESNYMFPTLFGVNDPRMGTMDRERLCMTCKGNQVDCPGHFGHIELARAVYNAGFLEYIRKILRCICFNCSKLLYPRDKDHYDNIKKFRIAKNRFAYILKMCEKYGNRYCDTQTDGCGMRQPKYTKKGLGIEVEFSNDLNNFMENLGYTSAEKRQMIWPEDCFRVFSKITTQDQETLGIKKPQNMIIKRLLVAPPPVRPAVNMGGILKQEDDLTYAYQMIIKANNYMQQQIDKGANQTTINDLRKNLQFYVATLMDNQIPGQPSQRHKSGKPLKAIRQRLKGKEGRIRGNLMGKRVDFSSRSVITPDPNLELDMLGVPLRIAQNLTIPVTVTPSNIDELRQMVANGPAKYPGAKYIIRHDNRQIDLSQLANRCDAHLEYGYKVERHLLNNDMVLFNRQPSLHKMSIMGHRVKVLPFSTFRLNLSVTSPYNADFDGDEMNMFVPQNYESLAEVKEIMAVPLQIVSPQANRPVMGIVQDSLLGIMLFTKRDNFFDKEVAMNLLMWLGFQNDKQLPIPAILKPKPLWSGKQIISLVIPNVNMIRFIEGNKSFCPPQEHLILIQRGELLTGQFNKSVVGSSQQGLIHIIWREQGHMAAKDFLSNAQNIINQWLTYFGFTVGIQDAIASKKTNQSIKDKLNFYKNKVYRIIDKAEIGKLKFQPGKNLGESFEAKVNNTLNKARDKAGQLAFKDLDPLNKIQNMVGAGSKGTNINISQIMGCVGQQNVEGKRIPFGFRHRSLPHFTKYDYGPESKGFVKNNYLSGLDPSEFFFHAMGGREGLIDTAVKTSETGYIQRRLIKALEDVMVNYDGTVRNSSAQVIQFLYGEDGMAGESIEDLKIDLVKMGNQELEGRYCFVPQRVSNLMAKEILKNNGVDDHIAEQIMENPAYQMACMREMKEIINGRDELRSYILKNNEDQIHVPVNISRLILNCDQQFSLKKHKPTNLNTIYVIEQVNNLLRDLTVYPGRKAHTYFSEANDNSTKLFKIYLRSELSSKRIIQQERMSQLSFDWLIGEIRSRFESSLIHPGEMVGSIAAHSLGEPATQMTLNTFHFAGVSSKNVTLGVPRLKEVINVAKNIKTPMASIYLMGRKKKCERSVMKVQGDIEHTTLSHIVESSGIYYDPDPTKTVITEDQRLVALYNEVPDLQQNTFFSPWVLRLKLDSRKVLARTLDMNQINRKLTSTFYDQIQIMQSDINDENLVLRLRFKDILDEPITNQSGEVVDYESAVFVLKEIEDALLNDLTLKGINEVTKVYAKKYNEVEYDENTGTQVTTSDNWMLETDGVALQKILPVKRVDHKRTISNDVVEIFSVLGIEAVRLSLINELRVVLNFYGIYVNYRHLATLCDVMTQRGRLTSITRHGINRLDTGPLRKCSFEETVEILLEAAVYNEIDNLKGITECIMMGMTAPLGTGSFDVVIDGNTLQQHAQTSIEEELMADDTPIQDDEFGRNYGYYTDYIQNTPEQYRGGATSEYGRTPGQGGQSYYDAGFSPGRALQSPSYQSPNPYQSPSSPQQYRMQSPIYGSGGGRYQSPIYNAYASPIYQPGSDGIVSPTKLSPTGGQSGISQSPNYSPNQSSQINSPYSETQRISYSPSYGATRNSPISSPSLIGESPATPTYSPPGAGIIGSSHHRSNANSPVYSPTMGGAGRSHSSPNYSPTTANYQTTNYNVQQSYSPSYSPTTPQYGSSPKYNVGRISPKYSTESPIGQTGNSPRSSHGTDEYGAGGKNSMYIPSLPNYNPNSPAYNRAGPSASGSVISDYAGGQGTSGPAPIYDPTISKNNDDQT